jgi:hypothetical protein
MLPYHLFFGHPPIPQISRIAINNFATRSHILQRFLLHYVLFFGNGFSITSLISFRRDMSAVIMNLVPKEETHNRGRICAVLEI